MKAFEGPEYARGTRGRKSSDLFSLPVLLKEGSLGIAEMCIFCVGLSCYCCLFCFVFREESFICARVNLPSTYIN